MIYNYINSIITEKDKDKESILWGSRILGCVIESVFSDVLKKGNVFFFFEGKRIQKSRTPQPLKRKPLRSFETRANQSSQQQCLMPQQTFTLNNTTVYSWKPGKMHLLVKLTIKSFNFSKQYVSIQFQPCRKHAMLLTKNYSSMCWWK
jgi:hypothetical protein